MSLDPDTQGYEMYGRERTDHFFTDGSSAEDSVSVGNIHRFIVVDINIKLVNRLPRRDIFFQNNTVNVPFAVKIQNDIISFGNNCCRYRI